MDKDIELPYCYLFHTSKINRRCISYDINKCAGKLKMNFGNKFLLELNALKAHEMHGKMN